MRASVIVSLLLIAVPVVACADQVSDLQSQLSSLLSQVTTLQSASTSPLQGPTAASSTCLSLTHNLSFGSTDAKTQGEVTLLQQFLGFASTTGFFGMKTQTAVQSWQSDHGVVATGTPATTGFGRVGPKTRSVLSCATTSPLSNAPVLSYAGNGPFVSSATSAAIGDVVTIMGGGFGASSSVQFGANYIGPLPSSAGGSEIVFVLPHSTFGCDPLLSSCALQVPVIEGQYPLTVHTPSGVSQPVPFVVRVATSTLLGATSGETVLPPVGALSVLPCSINASSTEPASLCDFTATWFTEDSLHATIEVFNAAHSVPLALSTTFSVPDYLFESPDHSGIHVFSLPSGTYQFVLVGYGSDGNPVVLQKESVTGTLNVASSTMP